MCQSPISCSSEGRQMDAVFKLPAATARTRPISCRQDRTPSAAVSTAPVGWSVCTALPCWACASACPNICCTSCRRRPAGFLSEQKSALQCLQKHYCLSVCAAWNADVQWLFTPEMIPCLLCATPGTEFCYRQNFCFPQTLFGTEDFESFVLRLTTSTDKSFIRF